VERAALEALVKVHQAELYRYLRYLGASPEAAEDLVQETFLAACRSETAPKTDAVRRRAAWLRGVARNLFLAHCRRDRSSPVRADSESLARAEGTWEATFLRGGDGFETLEALRACLRELPERQREVLDLRYRERRSRSALARLLKMTEDGVKSLLRRIRAALAACIERRRRTGEA